MKVGKLLMKVPRNCIVRVDCAGEFALREYPNAILRILQRRGDADRKVKAVCPMEDGKLLIEVQ